MAQRSDREDGGWYKWSVAVTDRRVDVGGRCLHVARSGSGVPAVILEAGSGCWSEHWRAVQELVGNVTSIYSYDRAGHGSSDPGEPWTLASWVADLEAWLSAAVVPPPYVLVGHSLGGHIVRTFAARHRADVAGLILVDARHEDLFAHLPEAFLSRLAELAPRDTEQARYADELVRRLGGLEGLPVSVITHGRADWVPDQFGLSQDDRVRAEQEWQRYQLDLAARFQRSSLHVARDSGHLIPVEQPEIVVSEIVSLIGRCAAA
jgi:pimeloyl-ACP methyl ester carboxylesterase